MPLAASAHSTLISSQPLTGQRLSSAPGVVVLDFSEPINIQPEMRAPGHFMDQRYFDFDAAFSIVPPVV